MEHLGLDVWKVFVDFFSGELWGDFLFECWNVFGFKGFFFKKY